MKHILDWNEYTATVRQAVAEGCVLLENKNNVLPLKEKSRVSVFGRIQNHYYKSGTGSGGKVNVSKVYTIVEALEESGAVTLNKKLQKIYEEWEAENPFDEGVGWGQEKWSQEEMPLTEVIVSEAAEESDVAVIIIGRTAGEDKDNSNQQGSYLLAENEELMMSHVRRAFDRVVVLLNVGNIIDMSFVQKYAPDAVLYVWQGGMIGALGVADLLTGKLSPSGKLADTIAKDITDYPSNNYFGNVNGNCYAEDIYVGYRYFETFAKDKVIYPFGYGLSYTSFETTCNGVEVDYKAQKIKTQFTVKNTGNWKGKEVIQLYVEAPCGRLGTPERILAGFEKTQELFPGQNQTICCEFSFENFASYDDLFDDCEEAKDGSYGTEHSNCYLLQKGEYRLYAGSDVRSAKLVKTFSLEDELVLRQCEQLLAPVQKFLRMVNVNGKLEMREVPVSRFDMEERRKERLPEEITCKRNSDVIRLEDVVKGRTELSAFIAQFSDEDLSCIVRGEGMGSSLVTPGTASAFGGVSKQLREKYGIPPVCCDDGPSGMRLDSGMKAFALPNGTLLACTFNCPLVTELYTFTGYEMIANNVENLLGPGMNIHRHPLNGRNFEYFSEDPLLTGLMGTAMLKGLKTAGVTGTVKHFCVNNQETGRHTHDAIVSERALREIYLKGFELAVKSGYADSVMTTYGKLNGLYTSSSYDLNTTLLRGEWGFKGIVMTDWWAYLGERGKAPDKVNFAAMLRAQNDLYMVCSDGNTNADGDNTLQALKDGRLTRAEAQRSAMNICAHVMQTQAMKRQLGCGKVVEIVNRPASSDDFKLDNMETVLLDDEVVIDLTRIESKMNTSYVWQLDVKKAGTYELTLTGSSELNELAQLPCTFFNTGIPNASFTFSGTGGKDVCITKQVKFWTRFQASRLLVGANGLKLKSLKIKFLSPLKMW